MQPLRQHLERAIYTSLQQQEDLTTEREALDEQRDDDVQRDDRTGRSYARLTPKRNLTDDIIREQDQSEAWSRPGAAQNIGGTRCGRRI